MVANKAALQKEFEDKERTADEVQRKVASLERLFEAMNKFTCWACNQGGDDNSDDEEEGGLHESDEVSMLKHEVEAMQAQIGSSFNSAASAPKEFPPPENCLVASRPKQSRLFLAWWSGERWWRRGWMDMETMCQSPSRRLLGPDTAR